MVAADALLFDLGRVVIDIDFGRCIERWAHYAGVDPDSIRVRFGPDEAYRRHERGEIEAATFFASLRQTLGISITDGQFLDGWNSIFAGPMPGIEALLAAAARRLPLYAFTSTNAAHKAVFSVVHARELALFRHVFISSDIGLRKPEPAAFAHVADEIGCDPARIVFFDDSLENIEGARAGGLQAVHVQSMDDVTRTLANVGIETPAA